MILLFCPLVSACFRVGAVVYVRPLFTPVPASLLVALAFGLTLALACSQVGCGAVCLTWPDRSWLRGG
eukprot:876526-Alexandrium_andersonii.AAC.1